MHVAAHCFMSVRIESDSERVLRSPVPDPVVVEGDTGGAIATRNM